MDRELTAELKPSSRGDGSAYLILNNSARMFGTRNSVKVRGTLDGHPFLSSFVAMSEGSHRLTVKPHTLKLLGKRLGDTVAVHLLEQFS